MRAYAIVENKIMVRDNDGDLFAFTPATDGHQPALRLVGPPRWKGGAAPQDAGVRIDLARGAARGIARDNGLIS